MEAFTQPRVLLEAHISADISCALCHRNFLDRTSLSAHWTCEPLQHGSSVQLDSSAGGKPYPDSQATIRLAQAEHEVLIELARRYSTASSTQLTFA